MATRKATAATEDPGSAYPESPRAEKGLVVFVPGLHHVWRNASLYEPLEKLLKEMFPTYALHTFKYLGSAWSPENPENVAKSLEKEIGKKVREESYTRIYLVGHSFGALIVRHAILLNARQEREVPWLERVERTILLAGANRGFAPYTRGQKAWASVCVLFQALRIPLGRLVLSGLRGSVWVTNLRMEWVDKSADSPTRFPPTVQIRGTQDWVVGPHDSVDITYSHNSMTIDIPNVGHSDLALLKKERLDEIRPAIAKALQEAKSAPVSASPLKAPSPPEHVVFLIHGIRDFAEWHEDLAKTIVESAKEKQTSVEVVPISYGYFTALQFLFLKSRRRCARAILDQYVQYFARYPKAQFSAVAHSNGTYALTWAMLHNRLLRWERLYLAGCVRPRGFPWEALQSQFKRVRNDCANRDWPVGSLCFWLGLWPLNWDEIGTAGVAGFVGPQVTSPKPGTYTVQNNQFYEGDHSSALHPKHHEEIASFILTGRPWASATALSPNSRVLLRAIQRLITLSFLIVGVWLYFAVAGAGLAPAVTVLATTCLTLFIILVLLLL